MHYGVPGMKWGKKSGQLYKKVNKVQKKINKLDTRSDKRQRQYDRRSERNELKKSKLYAKTSAVSPLNKLIVARKYHKILKLDARTMRAKYRADVVKDQLNKNVALQNKLKTKMNDAAKKEADNIRRALVTEMTKANNQAQKKINKLSNRLDNDN